MCSPLFVLLNSFTWPHNYTRNEAHLLPATFPHRHTVFWVIQRIHRTDEEPALGCSFPKHPLQPAEGQALSGPSTAAPSPSSVPQDTKDEVGQGIFTFSDRISPTKCQLWSCTASLQRTSWDSITHRCLFFLTVQDTCTQTDLKPL